MPISSADQFRIHAAFVAACETIPEMTTAQIFELRDLLGLESRRREAQYLAHLDSLRPAPPNQKASESHG